MKRRPALVVAFFLALALGAFATALWLRWISVDRVRFERHLLAWVPAPSLAFVWLRWAPMRSRGLRTHLEDTLVAATIFCLGLLAAGTEIGRPLDRLTAVILVDRSRSIDLVPGAEETIAREVAAAEQHMQDGDRIALVAFGANAVTEQPPRTRDDPRLAQAGVVLRESTDIEAALRRALAEVPPDSAARIVVVSDGVATRGDVMAGAAAALAAQIPIDTFVLEQGDVRDIRVALVSGPPRAAAGETVDLRVVTQSPEDAEIEVRVLLDGRLIRKGTARIAAGEDVLRLREKVPEAGLHRYDVEISATDPSLDATGEDNAGSTFIRVRGQAAVLVIEGEPGKGAFVANALRAAEMRVDEIGPIEIPTDLAGFVAYDLVTLSDVPASMLTREQLAALAAYVRDFGGGLLLFGGDKSFGPGGFGKTPVEEVSPVSFDLKQDQRRASLAEVIGIDISGSMGVKVAGQTKLELANEAASRSASLLGDGDRLGVEHVDMQVHWSVPLGPVTDMGAIDKAIRSMPVGGGGIHVPVTLQEGYAALDKEEVNLKHLLLFSDGDDADEVENAKPLAAAALSNGITTSVVALGNGKDVGHLEELAKLGGGRFYLIEDATRLPAVFAQETILAARSAVVEEPFKVATGALGELGAGIDFGDAPELLGYVVTIPKPRATIHLTGPDGDPVLATWGVGLGRSAAFTSDLKDRWGLEWTTWPGAARLVAQTARDILRRGEDERVRLESSATGGRLRIRATVIGDDGRADSFRRLKARIVGPGGAAIDAPLEPTSPGTYAADIPIDRPGTYVVLARDEVSGEAVGTSGAVLSGGEELRPTGSDRGLLSRLSEFAGGKQRSELGALFLDRTTKRFAYDDMSRALSIAAALGLLFAVAARKLGMPEALHAALARLRATQTRAPSRADRKIEPEPTVASLLAVKRAGPKAARPEPPPPPRAPVQPPPRPVAERPVRPSAGEPPKEEPRPPEGPAPPAARPMSTAELLVARRRAKK